MFFPSLFESHCFLTAAHNLTGIIEINAQQSDKLVARRPSKLQSKSLSLGSSSDLSSTVLEQDQSFLKMWLWTNTEAESGSPGSLRSPGSRRPVETTAVDVLIANLPVLRQSGLMCYWKSQTKPKGWFAFDVLFFSHRNQPGTKGLDPTPHRSSHQWTLRLGEYMATISISNHMIHCTGPH